MVKEEQQVTEQTELDMLGKFKSAAELLSAYNALEKEFTKRCQLIKELQTALELRAQEEPPAQPVCDPVPPEATEVAADGAKEEHILPAQADVAPAPEQATPQTDVFAAVEFVAQNASDCASAVAQIPEVMDACIARYKQRLLDYKCGAPQVSGMAVIMPAAKPRTLAEAKRLADDLLANA